MKPSLLKISFLNLVFAFAASLALAIPASDPLAQEEQACESIKNRPEWVQELKVRQQLTDQQISQLKGKGLSYPQMAILAKIAEKSGQSLDQLVEKRQQPDMSWAKLAVDNGVQPTEVSQSVAQIRFGLADKPLQYEQRERARRRAAAVEEEQKQQAKEMKNQPQLNPSTQKTEPKQPQK